MRAALADESSKHSERLEVLGKQLTQVMKSSSMPAQSMATSSLLMRCAYKMCSKV